MMIPDTPKRRWYQYSLRKLLLVMLVLMVTLGGWVQIRRHRARVNRARVTEEEEATQKAAAAIMNLVTLYDARYMHGYDSLPRYDVSSAYTERRPQTWLEKQFDDPGGSNDPVGVFEVMGVLEVITLDLSATKVTDVGLEHLKGLTNLQYLDLDATKVTDAGLEHLKGLKSLQRLGLVRTNVTDAGLEHLKGLRNLAWLDVRKTHVTDEGVKKLQQALPNCKITHGPSPPLGP